MHYELLFPSKYLKAVELKGREVTVTIEKVVLDELWLRGGGKQKKGVMHFVGKEKMMVLNRTKAEVIKDLYGEDTAAWVGKSITLYVGRTSLGRETVDAIMIRKSIPRPNQQQRPSGNGGNGANQSRRTQPTQSAPPQPDPDEPPDLDEPPPGQLADDRPYVPDAE